ncbi:DUF6125 family protein [Dehalobacter sp. DCM]|uniref:DUF6125 family protein n=1 Tax=Dehalobacter sp. DCM TaxID=2907827 RepID=UPI0030814E22|nr:DUF6125 family protein [Dehalobacter sp. DCM]
MIDNEMMNAMSKEELIELIGIYAKNWTALDGVWFQSVERKFGMDEAMYHDGEAWKRYTAIEAKRLKEFLKLPEQAGLEGLAQALRLRFAAHINPSEIVIDGNTLTYRILDCRVQTARSRKNLAYHPCKPVGFLEYDGFAKVIDPRIACTCLSCFPDVTDESCSCSWLFTLKEDNRQVTGN